MQKPESHRPPPPTPSTPSTNVTGLPSAHRLHRRCRQQYKRGHKNPRPRLCSLPSGSGILTLEMATMAGPPPPTHTHCMRACAHTQCV